MQLIGQSKHSGTVVAGRAPEELALVSPLTGLGGH